MSALTLTELRLSRLPVILLAAVVTLGALTRSAGAAPQGNLTDGAVASAVREQLLADPSVSGDDVDVSVANGVVTLDGRVDNILARDRAIRITQAIRGVRSVIDELAVDAPARSDRSIREDVTDALLYDSATESFEIDVTVNDQAAVLTGHVDSWQEKQLAGRIAKGVRGVKAIDNRITVEYESDRPDHEIKAEIEKALKWDVLVDGALIDVSVDDGAVTLAGTVGSSAEKREARYDAWVAGVNEVDVSGLEVGRWARDEDLRKDKYLTRSDSAVADAVEDAMLYDPRLSAFDIGVAVDDGVVTLGGQVDNVTARRVAAENARNTVGVWRVKNRIQVRTNELTDAKIKQNVLDALERDPDIRQYDIGVGVIGGEVFLSGTVDDYFDKARADDLAATAVGVSEVNNNIVVEDAGQAWTHDPYVDEYDLEGYDWQAAEEDLTTRKNDWEIYEDIRDELWWSPFVDSDEVAVSIEDGVATLTGTVDTWSEREAAQENAIEGGAIAVDNDLSVDFGPEYYQEGNQG